MSPPEFRSDLLYLLYQMKVKMQRIIDSSLKSLGISMLQHLLIHEIAVSEHMTIGQLGRCLNMSQGNASILCKGLERDGLITRTRDPNDERVVLLALTQYGRDINDRMLAKIETITDKICETMPERLAIIERGLKEMSCLLDDLQTEEE